MVQKKDIKDKLILLAAAATTAACLFIPEKGSAYDVKYAPYNLPDSLKIERIVSQNSFPDRFNFFYQILPNEEGFTGNFNLRKDKNKTELEIRVIDSHEDKLFNFSEEAVHDSVIYCEREFDYPKNMVLYQNRISFSKIERPSTLVSLINQALTGEIPTPSFIFQGSSQHAKKYSLETNSSFGENFDLVLTGRINNNSPRIPKVTASFKRIAGRMIPIELEVYYKLKVFNTGLFGTIYITPNIKGILAEKK
ncbi:hypothetical protein HYT23_00455 [Candidatus Pacearchaeota archaeon]|nr:hypothetical protein [Candidatus Pacearchaeota archaeon]